MSVTLQQEAHEALNGGIYETGLFEALGNTEGGRVEHWHAGYRRTPRQLQLSIARSDLADAVLVTAQWPAVVDGQFYRGQQVWTLPTGTSRAEVIDSSSEIVLKVLQLLRDVFEGTANGREAVAAARPDDFGGDSE